MKGYILCTLQELDIFVKIESNNWRVNDINGIATLKCPESEWVFYNNGGSWAAYSPINGEVDPSSETPTIPFFDSFSTNLI